MCDGRRGRWLVREAKAPLAVGTPWGWGYDMSGAGLAERGIRRRCWVEWWAAGWWVAEATPLEDGEEAPLEAVAEAPLELVGERGGWCGLLLLGWLFPVLEEVADLADGFKLFV